MLFEDTYRTIEAPAEGVFRDRGSKFLAFAYPVVNEAGVKDIVARLRAGHPKANHHCWAVRFGTDRSVFKLNDDGEPSGTAGRPILNILLSRDITNVIVIVVRYFGGNLLGVPGLINAYKQATEDVLNNAIVVERTVNDIYLISFEYLQMNEVMRVIKENDLAILSQQFDNACFIELSIRKMQLNQALARFSKLDGVTANYQRTG